MSIYLVKTTDVYRVDSVGEVEQFHKDLKGDPHFELESFAYQQKQVKQKGEIVDEYCLVTVKKKFNDPKEPTSDVSISYDSDVITDFTR
ncbi:MAG: hypothetical protein KIG63_08125 [Methanobrevibacter sp.]|nr:hypothetical protein [Methanobrevibacter sp.]